MQKNLTLDAVQQAAETLMLLHNTTSTLDVKNYLRRQNYLALQSDVSRMMSLSVHQKGWKFQYNGSYREYALGKDTDEKWKIYLVRGNDFWAIEVDKRQHITSLGKIGTNGSSFATDFSSNRLAVHKAKFLANQKKAAGFMEAVDPRLSRPLRAKYQSYLDWSVTKIRLSYFGIEKVEKQYVDFILNTPTKTPSTPNLPLKSFTNSTHLIQKGYFIVTKSAGYEFEADVSQNGSPIQHILKNKQWEATQLSNLTRNLTGEKITSKKAFDDKGESIQPFKIQSVVKTTTQSIKVNNDNLYQVKLTFDNGRTLHLSKFEMDLEKELLPLVGAFCNK